MTVFKGMLNSVKSQSVSKEWERCLMLCPKCIHKPTAMEINKVVVLKSESGEDRYWVKCPLCTHKETVTYAKAFPSSEQTKKVAKKPVEEKSIVLSNNESVEVPKEERAIDRCLYKLPSGNHVINGICVKKHKGRFGEEDSYNIGRDCYRTKDGRIPLELVKVFLDA